MYLFPAYKEERKLIMRVCRKADPESKGRIENVVGYIKANFAKHRVFHGLDKWNEEGMEWLKRTGNYKVHNTTKKETNRSVSPGKATPSTSLPIFQQTSH